MAIKREAKVIEFEFEIRPDDMARAKKSSRLYNEDDGVVAIAFRRSFPNESFACAHGDYYIGLGKSLDDCKRYVFDNDSTEKIGKVFKEEITLPVTVTAIRLESKQKTVTI